MDLVRYAFSDFYSQSDSLFQAVYTGNIDALTTYYKKHDKFPLTCGSNNDVPLYEICFLTQQSDVVCFLHRHGVELPSDALLTIGSWKSTTVDHIRYLHEHGFRWDEQTIFELMSNNNIDGIDYLSKQGYTPTDNKIPNRLLPRINVDCLQYLHKNGYVWDSNYLIAQSIVEGSYDKLVYAGNHSCPSDLIIYVNGGNKVRVPGTPCFIITPEIQMCLDYAHTNKLVTILPSQINLLIW